MEAAAVGVVGMGRLTDDQLRAWVLASCERHGVASKVTDPLVIASVAVLLSDGAARQSAKRGRAPRRSDTPDGVDPVRIQTAGTGSARKDDGVIEQRPHDGVLPVEVERGPLSA